MTRNGLAAERTRLAWRRTTLAMTVMALLAGRLALQGGVVLLAFVVGGWLAALALAHRRITALRFGPPSAVGRSPAVLALLILGYVLLGALLVLLPP